MVKGGSADREHGRAGSGDLVPGDQGSDDVGPDGANRRGAPFRRYSLIIAASIVPLVIAIVVLTGYQFVLQRERLLEELQNEALAHDVLLASVTKSIGDHVRSLGIWAQIYLAEHEPGREAGDDRAALGGGRFVRDTLADRPGATAELGAARRLEPHLRLAHQAMPYLRRSYYLSGGEDLAYVVSSGARHRARVAGCAARRTTRSST